MSEPVSNNTGKRVGDESNFPAGFVLSVLEVLPDCLYLFDDQKKLIFANSRAVSLQSTLAPLHLGNRCCDLFWQSGEDQNCVVDRAIENRQKLELEIPTPVATKNPLLLTVQPIEYLENDQTFGAMVIARDIFELRRAEAEAIAQRSFMVNLTDRSPDEIYALDKQGRVTWVNQRAEAGNPHVVYLGQRLIDFIADDYKEAVRKAFSQALSGTDSQAEVQAFGTDETMRDVEANTSPLWKDGEVEGIVVFLRDITERKRTQDLVSQSEKLRAVGELAAGVAHNLNNSLTVIKGRTQLLQMRTSDETSLRSFQVINDAVEDGSKTLRRILEFSRRDPSQDFGPVELDALITSSLEIARPKWERKLGSSAIELKVVTSGPIYIRGAAAELREVVLNLIFNACDAMPEGGIMEVGTRGEIDSGCFWIADTGCGMTPEIAARIFEPFFTTKGTKGTGLGLSASHGIITRHGGEIVAVSEPGEGTRFEIRLPLNEP